MKSRLQKFADGEAASVLPQIAVPSQPAQTKNTLPGMVPPIAYTKVNASTPPVPDAGAAQQKSQAPLGAQMLPKTAQPLSREDMNMTPRPLVQDLVKQAMESASKRVQIAAEGARQMKLASANGGAPPVKEKTASPVVDAGNITTEYVLKLAAAIEYAEPQLVEIVKNAAANAPPPRMTETQVQPPEGVTSSNQSGTPPGPGGQGKGHAQPPTNPGTQKAMPQEHGATQLENTITSPPGGTGTQTTAMTAGKGKVAEDLAVKNAGVLAKLAGRTAPKTAPATTKEASAPTSPVDYLLLKVKEAEDAINPASISAGAAVPPETNASGEAGGAPVGGMPQGPRGLVGSNESAINYKRQTAYAPRKSELAQYFSEPALSAATDTTLSQAFAHTGEAGVKISSADLVKAASARALLARIADESKGASPKGA